MVALTVLVVLFGLLAVVALRAMTAAANRARAAERELAALRRLSAPAGPARVRLTKPAPPRPVPVGRDTLLAVVHRQLAELERRRAARPAPEDAVPPGYRPGA